jgi:hypothetical protein
LWSFSNFAKYPLLNEYINMGATPPDILETTQRVLGILPPVWLVPPLIFIVVVLAFVFVIVVFI